MRLVYKASGTLVRVGDRASTFRGETVEVVSFRPPHRPSSEGKIVVRTIGKEDSEAEYYVGVIGAEWIEREDR